MSEKVKAKTLARLNIENCPYIKEQCSNCIATCEFEDTPTFMGKWVSEAEHKKEMDEFGRQNAALGVVCWDLKIANEGLVAENKKLKRDIAYLEIFHEDTLSKREGKEKQCLECED